MKPFLLPPPEMPRPRSDSLSQDESAAKRRRMDDPQASLAPTEATEVPPAPHSPPTPAHPSPSATINSFAHRLILEGRATGNNAADTRHFIKHKSLVFHFLDVSDIVENDIGQLTSCKLQCGVCGRGNWKWAKAGKAKGSTSNMVNHMKEKHEALWRAAEQSDKVAQGIVLTDSTGSETSAALSAGTNPVCYVCAHGIL